MNIEMKRNILRAPVADLAHIAILALVVILALNTSNAVLRAADGPGSIPVAGPDSLNVEWVGAWPFGHPNAR